MTSKAPTPIAASLDEFSERVAKFYAEIGQPDPNFAGLIRDHVRIQRIIGAYSFQRSTYMDALKRFAESGTDVSYNGRILKRSKPSEIVTVRHVNASKVNKAHPRLWEAAKVPTPYVSFSLTSSDYMQQCARAEIAVGPSYDAPIRTEGLRSDVLAARYLAVPSTKLLRAQFADTLTKIEDVARLAAWDGLPVKFEDGASVQLKRMQYSSDQLKIIAPELWESLAEEQTRGGQSRWYFAALSAEDREDDAD